MEDGDVIDAGWRVQRRASRGCDSLAKPPARPSLDGESGVQCGERSRMRVDRHNAATTTTTSAVSCRLPHSSCRSPPEPPRPTLRPLSAPPRQHPHGSTRRHRRPAAAASHRILAPRRRRRRTDTLKNTIGRRRRRRWMRRRRRPPPPPGLVQGAPPTRPQRPPSVQSPMPPGTPSQDTSSYKTTRVVC